MNCEGLSWDGESARAPGRLDPQAAETGEADRRSGRTAEFIEWRFVMLDAMTWTCQLAAVQRWTEARYATPACRPAAGLPSKADANLHHQSCHAVPDRSEPLYHAKHSAAPVPYTHSSMKSGRHLDRRRRRG